MTAMICLREVLLAGGKSIPQFRSEAKRQPIFIVFATTPLCSGFAQKELSPTDSEQFGALPTNEFIDQADT